MNTVSGFALVIGKAAQKWEYDRLPDGESQRSDRRKTNEAGHEVSGVPVVADLPLVGMGTATLLAPDSQLAEVEPGALMTFTGAEATVRPGDFGQVKVTLSAERITPAGDGIAALEAATKSASNTGAGKAAS